MRVKLLTLFCVFQLCLFAKPIETFYGTIEVEEPVLIELIESPSFQRLKFIHQYGIAYYTTHNEEYSRYAHSLGVFTILRKKGASLEEQIAGLLHDVSHTVFSHVGEWIFNKEYQDGKGYQDSIHLTYLNESGLTEILGKHGFAAERLLPEEEFFPMLEQKKPNLSADRIDYNIQGAYYQNFITYDEALEILTDLTFKEGKWVSSKKELMEKLVRFTIFMSQDCFGSATNWLSSRWLADAILRAIEVGCLTIKEIHHSTDQVVWDRLIECKDPIIAEKMKMVLDTNNLYSLVTPDQADMIVIGRFLASDPWINQDGKITRLTSIDNSLKEEFLTVKERMQKGWAIKLKKNAF